MHRGTNLQANIIVIIMNLQARVSSCACIHHCYFEVIKNRANRISHTCGRHILVTSPRGVRRGPKGVPRVPIGVRVPLVEA